MDLRAIEYRQLLQIVTMFMIVQFFGLLLATQLYSGQTFQQLTSTQVVSSSTSALFYIAYVVILAAVLLLVFRIYKGAMLFILLEGAVVFITSFFVFLIVFEVLLPYSFFAYGAQVPMALPLAIICSAFLIAAKNKWQRLRNTAAIIASVGVGVVLGSTFSFLAAFVFMLILAVYDFIAVFITKHMVTMARAMSERNLAFLVGVHEIEAVPESALNKKERSEYLREKPVLVKKGGPIIKEMIKRKLVPVPARVELGTGDLAIPLMLAVSAYTVYLSLLLSLSIIIGAIFGLIFTMWLLRKYRIVLPAIPPILFGILIAMAIYFLVGSI